MKKNGSRGKPKRADRDTMRPEYDFTNAVRGATAARCTEGSNLVVIDPAVMDVFPDGASVNEALRTLAPMLRSQIRSRPGSKRRRSGSGAHGR